MKLNMTLIRIKEKIAARPGDGFRDRFSGEYYSIVRHIVGRWYWVRPR